MTREIIRWPKYPDAQKREFMFLTRRTTNRTIAWPENGKKHYSWRYFFYYWTELIQILVSLRYEYILYNYYFFKYCVLVEISWPEGLRFVRLHDLKMEIQTYNRLYFFFITEVNRFESKFGQFEIWIYIL
jgi:hypothetical protein